MKKWIVASVILTLLSLPITASQTHKPGEVVVKFVNSYRGSLDFELRDGNLYSGIADLDRILSERGFENFEILISDYDYLRKVDCGLDMIFIFRSNSDKDAVESLEDFIKLPYIEFAELNYAADFFKSPSVTGWEPFYTPNDPYFSNQWFLGKINAPDAWDVFVGNHNSIVGVVDDGCEKDHADLNPNYITGYDYVNNDNDPTPPTTADNHGTHCSGLAAGATNNGIGIAAASHNVGLIGVRTYYLSQCAQGIYFCSQNNASVISMSWGPGSSQIYAALVDAHDNYDVICIGAAGNDNVSTPHYPAAYDNVVAVASSGSGDLKSTFSNYGSWVDLAAPGEGMYSTVPFGTYDYMDGTSMACPLTAGLAGLVRVLAPTISADSTKELLKAGCDPMTMDPYYNSGQLGSGRINVYRTIGKAGFTDFKVLSTQVEGPGGSFHILPGQQGTVEIVLECDTAFNSAASIQITASSPSPAITFTDSISDFGNANPGDTVSNTSDPIEFMVSSSATVQFVEMDFLISSNPDPMKNSFSVQFTAGGIPGILIVNGDINSNYIDKYTAPLDNLSQIYDVWNRQTDGPVGTLINDYSMVIWFSGDATATDSVLSSQDISDLSSYINAGKDLFITGQNIAEYLGGNSFSTDYLHVNWIQNLSTPSLQSITGSIFDPLMIATAGGLPANQTSRDVIGAVNGGADAFKYYNTTHIGAVTYFQGAGKVVFFGFGFEAIHPTGPFAPPDSVLKRILDWFETGVEENPVLVGPDIRELFLAVHGNNIFSSQVLFSADVPDEEEASVYVFDVTGRIVKTLASGLTHGSHRISWDGKDERGNNVSGGNYVVRMIGRRAFSSSRVLLVR
ncbi:S8 family serine peptidase [candidate division WOR-3 bacterium]|nr:S8 family serine peptidase [candidate division WOR-3 bacterium]